MKKQIPNLITLGNLLCGVLSCYMAAKGFLRPAAIYICLGIFLDFFDGMAARLLGVTSPLGKELDSLADVVTSGVAPGIILFQLSCLSLEGACSNDIIETAPYLALLMPLFAAYRLAKFNLDTRQSHSFLGLPAPANALIWVGLALGGTVSLSPVWIIILLCVSLLTDILMISELPMFSLKFNFKEMDWRKNSIQYIFLIVCALIIAATRQWYAISLIIVWYIILSLFTRKRHHA
ncbi:MAG: CDP-diacylglycerol--serine O-phosphatidyltransferase [Bacteroidales bacterium]|nr:CDP-diacylglycerol--serine O-phosphatidyltransferase [Bacteroidales bacterium]